MAKKRKGSEEEGKLPSGLIESSWMGIRYVRTKPLKVANPRTEGQVNQRNKMSLSLPFLRANILMVRSGFRFYSAKRSAFNAALSYLIKNGFTGFGDDLEIDYNRVLLSRGELEKPLEANYRVEGSEVVITWDGGASGGNAKASDRAMVSVYDSEENAAVTLERGPRRADGHKGLRMVLPESFQKASLKVFLAFNSSDEKMVSDSVLCTEVMAPVVS